MAAVSVADLTVEYPGVRALSGVSVAFAPARVHALMGENGAGKSTLIKVLCGLVRPARGSVSIAGTAMTRFDPGESRRLGVRCVHQELELIPTMSVAENVCLGRETVRWRVIRVRADARRTRAALERVGLSLAAWRTMGDCSPAEQQLTAIARALDDDPGVLILDEPTSSLDARGTRRVLEVIARVRDAGVTVVLVAHSLEQVYAAADTITVLRNGAFVGQWPTTQVSRTQAVRHMTGRDPGEHGTNRTLRGPAPVVEQEGAGQRRSGGSGGEERSEETGGEGGGEGVWGGEARTDSCCGIGGGAPCVLEVEGLRGSGAGSRLECDSLRVGAGSVVGIAGLLGSGRSSLVRAIFGAGPPARGSVRVCGVPVRTGSVRSAIRSGLAMAPEDRRAQGLFLSLSVRENMLAALRAARPWWRIGGRTQATRLTDRLAKQLDVRAADLDAPVSSLSGGNQQKALLARWIAVKPRLLILDEPTRGIDVGARGQIESLIRGFAEERAGEAEGGVDGGRGEESNHPTSGARGVIVVSSETDQIVRVCDRARVMRDGVLLADVEEMAGDGGVAERRLLGLMAGDDEPARMHAESSFSPEEGSRRAEACRGERSVCASETEDQTKVVPAEGNEGGFASVRSIGIRGERARARGAMWPGVWPLAGVVLLVLANAVFDLARGIWPGQAGSFLHVAASGSGAAAGALIDVLRYGSLIAIVAIGAAPVLALRGVDLSIGSVMALGGVAGVLAGDALGLTGGASLCAAALVGALCGCVNGVLVGVLGVSSFIATLVTMVAARGAAQMLSGGVVLSTADGFLEFLALGGVGIGGEAGGGRLGVPAICVLACGLGGAARMTLRATMLGAWVRCVGVNREAARLTGVPDRGVIVGAFVFSGMCAGLAGLLGASFTRGADPFNAGRAYELYAIFACVVGGVSLSGGVVRIGASMAGALLLQCLTTTMYARDVSADVAPLPQAGVILLVAALSSPVLASRLRARARRKQREQNQPDGGPGAPDPSDGRRRSGSGAGEDQA